MTFPHKVIVPTQVPDGAWVLPTRIPEPVSAMTSVPTPAAAGTPIPVVVTIITEIPGTPTFPTPIPEYYQVSIGDIRGAGRISAAVTQVLMSLAAELAGRGEITVAVSGMNLGPVVKSVQGQGRVSASASMKLPGAGALQGSGRVHSAVSITLQTAKAVEGAGQVTASAVMKLPGSGLLAGQGRVEAAVSGILMSAARTIQGQGRVEASVAGVTMGGNAALLGQGRVDASAEMKLPAAALLSGKGVISATGSVKPDSAPMGMDKSGTMALASGTYTKVTGWVVRTGYPDTVITSDALVVSSGSPYVINWRIQFGGTGTSGNVKGGRLKINGTVVQTVSAAGNGSNDSWRGGSWPATLNPGDVITIEASHNSTSAGNREVQPGSAYTYLYFDLAP